MREGIHPNYYQATVTCNCGNTFVTGSTKPEIHVEVCSKCHSFYTGQQKSVAACVRIDKFNKKYGIASKQYGKDKVEVAKSQPVFKLLRRHGKMLSHMFRRQEGGAFLNKGRSE